MENVGEFFRHVRETKGLTLDAVASKTCIHPDFLRALEENNFAKLPDQVFAKGFVRSYARSLGLDEQEAMRRFVESAGPFYEKQGEHERLRQKQVEDERRRRTSRQVVAGATVVGLLALILLLTREQSTLSPVRRPVAPVPATGAPINIPPAGAQSAADGQSQPAPSPFPATASPSSEAGTLPGPAISTSPVDGGGSSPTPGAEDPASVPDVALALDVEALELTWVLVRIDGGAAQEVMLKPGDRVRWKGSDQFALTLGNAGGVRIALNGREQGPFGPRGQVVRDIIIKR
jgi:cytoskeletal protein RodZ